MPLISSVQLRLTADLTSVQDLATGRVPLDLTNILSLTNGVAAGQADQTFEDTRTLAPSATEDLDFSGTTLQNPFGVNIAFARIKAIYFSAKAANTNNVVIGATSATQWAPLLSATGTITLRPGASFVAFTGAADATAWPVGAGATDLLKVANSAAGTSVSYDIVVIGATA